MICDRCGTPKQPIGPRYDLDGWGRECLRYACYACGYSWTEQIANAGPVLRVVPSRSRDKSSVLAKAR